MTDKVSAGQPLASITANRWNQIDEATDYYQERVRFGTPGQQRGDPIPSDIVKIENTSGSDWEAGDLVALGDPILDNAERGHHWFEADDPAADSVNLAILIRPLKDGEIGYAQVLGIAIAKVNVRNTAHRRCDFEAGSNVLQSHFEGPIPLLAAPSGTGEELLFVRFPPVWGLQWAKAGGSGISGRSSGTMGSATITLYEDDDSETRVAQKDAADADREVTGYNGYAGDVADDAYVQVRRDSRGRYVVVTEECGG